MQREGEFKFRPVEDLHRPLVTIGGFRGETRRQGHGSGGAQGMLGDLTSCSPSAKG